VILRELFTNPNEFETMAETYEVAAYKFKTQDGRVFTVEFEEDNDEQWEFTFKDETGSMQKTGKGSAVEIFSTVGAIAKRFMTKYKPTEPVYFQAANAEPSRVKLYDRLSKAIVKEFPTYKVIRDVEANYTSYYVLPKDSDALDYLEGIEESENLNELLTKPLPFKLKSDDEDWVQYNFMTSDQRKFHVMFDNFYGNWTVEFADNEMSKGKTGKGGAVEIFATVAAIMRDFMKRHKEDVKSVTFRAEGASRIKLYSRLAQMANKEFPQFDLRKSPSNGGTDFTLTLPKDNLQKEDLNELLDQPLDFKLTDDDPGWIRYSFTTSDDRQFEVLFDEGLATWDIVFVDDEENTEKTGKGGSIEIFATVKAIVKDFIKRQGSDLEGLRFNAQGGEASRVRLYDRFAKMIAQEYPQWKIKSQAFHGGKEWILRKPRPGYSFDNPEDEVPAENINELFNQPLKYNKVVPRASDEGKKLTWRFDTPKGNRYQVEAYFSKNEDKWEFGFYDFEDDSAEITGKGDAAQVFATVIKIGEEFLADVKPRMVEFFADKLEPSRVKLYHRMVKTIADRTPEYEIKTQDYGGSYMRYVMIRKDSIKESVDRELEEFVSQNQLNDVERFAEKLFKKYNIDVDFTRHFFDRVNDERNVKIGGSEITVPELQRLFKKEQRQWGKKLAALPDGEEGVMKDKETSINVPFVKKDTPEPQPDKIITKTAMKKPNFKSNTPFYPVESKRLTLRSLFEAPGKTAAFAFGRLNPATNGHELLVNEIVKQDGDAFLYLSDRPAAMPKDPLEPKDKQAWAQASFPQIQVKLANNALLAADELYKMGYTNLIYLEGEPKMGKVIQKYNGQETPKHNFNFDNVNLVQLTRDPDAEGATGMSATKLRKTVTDNDFEAFKQGITKPAQGKAKAMFDKLQAALGTTESAAGPPSGDYAAYKKSIGASSAAGPSDGSYEKSKEEAPVKWQRGLWEHIFTSQQSGFPYIKQESRTAWIPLVSSTLRILQKEEKRTMYGAHVMGIKDIPKLMKLQGKKGKQISAFTTDEYGDLEGGVWTEGGIIAILKGTAMSSGQGDIMSKVDKQGRRVVDFGPQSPAMNIMGKYADSKAYLTAIQPIVQARAKITKELEDKFGPETYKVDPKAKHESIKEYMDVVNATLKEYTKVFKKIIFGWAESQSKNWKDTEESEYDEIVMGDFKIIKLFVKPSSRDQNAQTYQFRDFFEKNDFPFPIEYVKDPSTQHLKRYLDQNDVEESIEEEAKSKAQQRFMGMVHAAQKGEKPASPEVAKVAKNMKKKDAEDFASTKHRGKPEHVKTDSIHRTGLQLIESIVEDDDFDDDGNRRTIGADEAPKWTRSLFDHIFIKQQSKYDKGDDRAYAKGDKEVFIPLVPAMIDKLVGGPTELYGAHSTGPQNLDRLIQMQNKKGKQISVFTTDREGQLSDGVWGGGGVVAILRGNAYASSTGDIMSVVDKQGRRVLDIGPSGDLMNLEDNEDLLYEDEYPNMLKAVRSVLMSITPKIQAIIDERGGVDKIEGKEKAEFIKSYIDGLYVAIPKHKKVFSKIMVGWARSQNKNWQEVHGSYDEVVMGNYKIVHIFLIGKTRQQVSQLESFMQEKAMGYTRQNGRYVEDPNAKDPFIEKLYKEGKLKLIDKTEEEFPYQVLDTYMKRNKEMSESARLIESYQLNEIAFMAAVPIVMKVVGALGAGKSAAVAFSAIKDFYSNKITQKALALAIGTEAAMLVGGRTVIPVLKPLLRNSKLLQRALSFVKKKIPALNTV
jgi:hypothetical protein